MFTKQFRFNLVQLVFNYIFRLESELSHDLNDVILLSTSSEEKVVLEEIITNFEIYKAKAVPFLSDFGWERTPFLSRAALITFIQESAQVDLPEQNKIIAEYLHLTQDLAGADSVALVHAVIGKMSKVE
jgi:transcription termination factor NusB